MRFSTNPNHRKAIFRLRKLAVQPDLRYMTEWLCLKNLDKTAHELISLTREVRRDCQKTFATQFEEGHAFLAALTYTAIACDINKPKQNPIPANWISSTKCTQPTFAFHVLLSELASCFHGALINAEHGLANQTRVLTRTFLETSALTLVLLGDNELFRQFVRAKSIYDAKNVWTKHFKPYALAKSLTHLENRIGLPHKQIRENMQCRHHIWERNSASTHIGLMTAFTGNYRLHPTRHNWYSYCVLGSCTSGISERISELNWLAWNFLFTFWEILDKQFQFKPSEKLWRQAKAAYGAAMTFGIMREIKEHNNLRKVRQKKLKLRKEGQNKSYLDPEGVEECSHG